MYPGERFNSISHLAGAAIAAVGLIVLIFIAIEKGDPWKIASLGIYGGSLLLLYIFSTLYHSFRGRIKSVFQKLDHLAIYLLIAGTYTPITLITLRGPWGWSLFGIVWGLALVGMIIDLLPEKGRRIIPVIIYLIMGWVGIFALKPLWTALPPAGLLWLLAGGLFYTGGVVFFAVDKRMPYAHGIWHLFVLAGSICHYLTILGYVA